MLTRNQIFDAISTNNQFDLLIIGGGATGSGIALDAISRGYKVLLVEKADFASGTSSKSTKLVHGGVRYLEQAVKNLDKGQFKLVYEALHERAIFLKLAPHLSRPLPIFTPLYKFWEKPYYRIGLKLYDWLAGKTNIGKSKAVNNKEALQWFPTLNSKSLKGGVVYFDGQFDDARMNITMLKTAAQHGALLLNYAPLTALIHEQNKLVGATIKDSFTDKQYTIRAKGIINATGPFVDSIRLLDDPNTKPMLTVSSGAHVIIKQKICPDDKGFLIPNTEDGRVLFMLPWNNSTLVGTTDQPAKIEFNPTASTDDINYIVKHLTHYFNLNLGPEDILSSWSGLRPLVSNPDSATTATISRDHVLLQSSKGLLTITGGKWTTYRLMAEDTINAAIKTFKLPQADCITKQIKLSGANGYTTDLPEKLTKKFKLDMDIAIHLAKAYGANAWDILQKNSVAALNRLHPDYPYIEAEVSYAITSEYAQRASDILCRRTRMAFLNKSAAQSASKKVIEIMTKELNWDENRIVWEQAHWADIF